MSKTIKDKIVDLIKDTPVSIYIHKKFIPYIHIKHFNMLIENIKNENFKTPNWEPFFDTKKKNVCVYSCEIQNKAKEFSIKLHTKYQRKVDKFLEREYKKLLKKAKNGRKKRN